jgi:hypothetical protein
MVWRFPIVVGDEERRTIGGLARLLMRIGSGKNFTVNHIELGRR